MNTRLQVKPGSRRTSRRAKILLLGEPSLSSYFRRVLEKRGYECSLGEGAKLDPREFDLILSALPMEGTDRLLTTLAGSRSGVFICQPSKERGFVWAPVMLQGERCINAPALSPSDFIAYLDRVEANLNYAVRNTNG